MKIYDADDSGERLGSRAMAAYFKRYGQGALYPTTPELVELNGKEYVVLYNTNGILTIYRVIRSTRVLRALKRYPKELVSHYNGE